MQNQRRNHSHGFHHDAIRYYRRQSRNAVVVGEAQRHADSENQRHIGKNRSARFCHNVRYNGWQPAEVSGTDTQQDTCDREYGYRQHQRFTDLLQVSKCILKHN
ncbi:Uncharacterised protein [Salmonella enterica subsp. enterica serovar Bovismorbificans]|nr:Uncharacterised protein [Salmonella enterica subsp. enterica serovar Bovismorbificans]